MSITKARYNATYDPERYAETERIHDYYTQKIDNWIIAFCFVVTLLFMAITVIVTLKERIPG